MSEPRTYIMGARMTLLEALAVKVVAEYIGSTLSEFTREAALRRVGYEAVDALASFLTFHPSTRDDPELRESVLKLIARVKDAEDARRPQRNEGGAVKKGGSEKGKAG